MKKIAKFNDVFVGFLACFVLMFFGIIFAACGDKYEGLKVNLSVSEIVLKIENGVSEEKQIIAMVEGAESISRELAVSTDATQLNITTSMSDQQETIITISASAVCTNAVVVVQTLEGGKTATFTVTVEVPVQMINSASTLEQFFVLKGQAKNLASANLIGFTPSNTTQKNLNFELITQNPNVSLENGMLLVGEAFTGTSVDIRATSPHLAGSDVVLTVDVLPMLNETTVALQSITYLGAELQPIYQLGQADIPNQIELSANLAARQTVEFVFEVQSNKAITMTPFVLSTNGQNSKYLNFATGIKTEVTDGNGNLLSTRYVFELSAEGSLGQDAICFKVKFDDFDYNFTTQPIDVVVKDTVNKIQLLVDGVLSNQLQFTVYNEYKNKIGLALSFNVLPTTVSVAEKTLVLELGLNAGAYKFLNENGEELEFIDGKLEFDGDSKIFVRASDYNALSGQVKIYAKENPVVKQVLTFNAAAGTTEMSFLNASETVTAPNGDTMYYYNLSSNEATEQIVQFDADTATLQGLTVELSGSVIEITSAPIPQADFFQFTIQSVQGKEGTATITLRQANGFFVQAYVRVIYELVEDEVAFFVPSAQTNSAVGFMERQNEATWQFRVAITKGASVTLTREGLGVEGVEYGFYDILKTEDNQTEYENFFAQTQANPSALTYETTSQMLDTKFLALDQLKPATVGKTWVQVVVKGLQLEETEIGGVPTLQLANVEYKYYFLVEGYIPAQNFALSTYALNLYSQASVGFEDLDKTTADVVVSLNDATYQNITWLNASPLYQVDGKDVYKTEVSADNKTLSITALSTWTLINGAPVLADAVEFAFTALIKEFNTEYRLSVVVKITRAVQVEKIVVENVNLDTGIYIPLTYDQTTITRQILASVQVGESGKMPYNTNLVYEFLPYITTPANAISLDKTTGLLTIAANATEGTYGQIRIAPADRYNTENQYVAGANDVAVYFTLVVADGQSRETSFRVASLSDFEKYAQNATQMQHLHFTIVDDITITTQNALDEDFAICANFAGGLYGAMVEGGEKSVITTSLPLFGTLTEKAVVADLMLCGEVVGAGFVANENKGLIKNVVVDAKQQVGAFAAPSVLNAQTQSLGVGGIVGINAGSIENATFAGQIVGNLSANQNVGGIAGISSDTIDFCAVELCAYIASDGAQTALGKIDAGAATVGGLVGKLTDGKLTNSYIQSYIPLEKADALLTGGKIGVLVGGIYGGSINTTFGFVQNQQDMFAEMSGTENLFVENAYITHKAADDAAELGTYFYNFTQIKNTGAAGDLAQIQTNDVWDASGALPIFKAVKITAPITEIESTFADDFISANQKAILMFWQTSETLNNAESLALSNLNFVAFEDIFENAFGIRAFSNNAAVIAATPVGLQIVGTGVASITFYSKYNAEVAKTFDVYVINPITNPTFIVGTNSFGENFVLNVKTTQGAGFSVSIAQSKILDARAIDFITQDFEMLFNSSAISGNNPFTVSAQTLTDGKTEVTYTLQIAGTDTNDVLNEILGDKFSGEFTINVYRGADKIEISAADATMQPSDITTLNVQLFTDVKIEDGEGLEIVLSNFGAFPSDLFDYQISLLDTKFYADAQMQTLLSDAQNAKYFVYNFEVKFVIKDAYRANDFANKTFAFFITSQTALANQQNFGFNLVYKPFEIIVNNQEILSVTINHFELTNKSVLMDAEENKNFVFYEYNTKNSNNIIAPGEEGLLKFDIYPSFATWDYLDITFTQQNGQDLSLSLSVLEKYINPQNGNVGFRQSKLQTQPLENGIRIFGFHNAENASVATLYLGTYLPISTNKDAVFEIDLSANDVQISSFNLVVEYLEDAMIQIVDTAGNVVSTVARGTTSTLFITLPKDQNLSLDFVNILGVVNGLESAEKSISLTRTQIIEDEYSLTRTFAYALTVGSQVELENAENYITIEVTTSWIVNGKMQKKVSTHSVGVVDFKVDQITLLTDRADKTTFYSYIGVESILKFDFDGQSNTNSNASFQAFLQNFYYAALSNVNSYGDYIVNVGKAGNASFLGNLYYVNGSTQYALLNDDGSFEPNNYFTFTQENGQIKIIGKRQGEVNLRFVMQVQYPHTTITNLYELTFDFTIVVAPYSDENLPLIIDNETAFYDALESDTPQDYILMKDIYLDNVSPLSTNSINSLDGNNFTIHINSFNTETTAASLSLALFDNVAENTTLKNLTINLYGNNKIEVNPNVVSELQIAGLAISNDGIIYNCQVVAYATNMTGNAGIDVSYGGNIADTFTSTTAGFVITNNGFITNSRVGGTTFEKANGTANPLETFVITAQGNISGFVDTNSGTISSSFFANGTLTNATIGTLSSTTSGFARYNTGTITTSYAKGTGEEAFSLTGKGITTAGTGAGFIAINNGEISNCYANIMLASEDASQSGRLSAGFVHSNMGTITTSFTASKIENAKTTQMAFVGVDDAGNLLNTGTIKNGYYYTPETIEGDAYSNQTANLNVVRVTEPNNPDNFYGFSFADSKTAVNGVWFSTGFGIDLVSANQIAISNRYIANEKRDDVTGELLSYNLPYTAGYEYGSQINPIIIRNATEFNRAVGGDHENAGTAIAQYYNLAQNTVFGHYRIIANINLQDLNPDNTQSPSVNSTNMILDGGVLDGNMLWVTGVDLTANTDSVIENFGLFKALQNNACIKNLNITVVSVSAKPARFVGTLAGTAENSKILSITIKNQSDIEDSTILGNNVVGGLVGLVSGQSEIKDITITGLGVKANALATTTQNYVRGITNQSLSYAGGVIGIADVFTTAEKSSSSRKTETQIASLANLVANGKMQVRASTAGGVIGLIGPQTNLRDATFESPAQGAKIVAYNFFAGGIAGECYGNIDMAKAQHDTITQKQIEDNVSTYYQNPAADVQRGNMGLFDDTSDGEIISTYSPIAIGGIVGNLITGEIQHSYSKLNVKNQNATFAGGLVGQISSCQNPKAERNQITFFETYAFGDVAAKTVAGGIVGYIDNTRTVVMTKVNAVNNWGVVLDQKGDYHIADNAFQIYGATNAGNLDTLATYDKANNVVNMNGTDILPKVITTGNPEDMFAITEVKFANTGAAISEYLKPSFAFMEGNAPYNLVYDPYYGLQTAEKGGAEEISSQAVTPYYDLTDPATNGLAMDTYFVQANWDTNYWVRYTQTNDLLPSLVTFTQSMCYYIDVAADLQKMLYHPYATFIVRGLNQPSTIIPVGDYIESTNLVLANFSGTLKGMDNSLNYGLDFDNKSSFILATTGASFYNLTIQDIGASGVVSLQNQAFIDTATQTTFENILIKNCYATTQISENNFNIGILANKLVGGYLNGVSVQNCVVDGRVASDINTDEVPFINVGMVAGQLQTLSNAICQITDVCVYQTSSESNFQNVGTNNVSVSLNGANLEATEISVGAIFGETLGNVAATFSSKSAGDLVKGIGVATSTLKPYEIGSSTAQNPKGIVLTLAGSGNAKTFNAGLLFGKVNTMKVSFARTVQTQKLQVVGGINQAGDSLGNLATVAQANLGGMIGKVETIANIQNNTTGTNKFAQVDVGANFVAQTINAGALVGMAANLGKVENLETFGEISAKGDLQTNLGGLVGTLNSSIEIAGTISNTSLKFVGQNAFVGGILGAYTATSGALVIGDENYGTKYMGSIAVTGENIAVGGILGAIVADTNILSNATIQKAVFDGEITLSKMTGNAWVGGILGNSKAASSITAPNVTLSNCLALGDINVLHDYYAQSGLDVKVYVGGLLGQGSSRTTLTNNISLATLASKTSTSLDGVNINALVGDANGAQAPNDEKNFYAHQMSLCLDFNDGIGATNLYYKQTTETAQVAILDLLEDYIGTLSSDPEEGTKLMPLEITSQADWQNAGSSFEKEKTQKIVALVTQPFTIDKTTSPLTATRAHIMGDGHQIIAHNSLFATVDAQSAISGLSLIPSIENGTSTSDEELNISAIGTVANINNGFVFACAVKTTNISAHEHTSLKHSTSAYIGGIVGFNSGVIMDSFSAINISANANAGGVAGYNTGNIISTYSVGNVNGGYAFTQGDGAVYSSYTASPATAGVFGTKQTVIDSFYDLYSVGKKSLATETTDTQTFSVLDTAEDKELIFENAQMGKKFAFVVGENFGYPTFAGSAYENIDYMRGIATGTGTEDNPILIGSVGKLQQISNAATNNLHYQLICDMAVTSDMQTMYTTMEKQDHKQFNKNFAVTNWAPIKNFKGTLSGAYGTDGKYAIQDFTTSTSVHHTEWAIFGAVENANISNLKITYSNTLEINATTLAGLATSVAGTTIDKITLDAGTIKSTASQTIALGGLIGKTADADTASTITNIEIKLSKLEADKSSSATVGGLIANMQSASTTTLENITFANGFEISTAGTGANVAGGLAGKITNIALKNVNFKSAISITNGGNGSATFGGLAGSAQTISSSNVTLSSVTIGSTGTGKTTFGGLFGTGDGVQETFSAQAGTITLTSKSDDAEGNALGGIAGALSNSVIESTESSPIAVTGINITQTGTGTLYAGGVAGTDTGSTINNLAPAATITNTKGGMSNLGGIVGSSNGTEIHGKEINLESFVFTIGEEDEDVDNPGEITVGGLVGYASNETELIGAGEYTVNNSLTFTDYLSTDVIIGGLAGYLDGSSVSAAKINKIKLKGPQIGAVAGHITGSTLENVTISEPDLTATFNSSNIAFAGGVSGKIEGNSTLTSVKIENGTLETGKIPTTKEENADGATENVEQKATSYIGGFAGQMSGTITGGSSSLKIKIKTGGYAGGLVGKGDDLTISNISTSPSVSANLEKSQKGSELFVGGIVGEYDGGKVGDQDGAITNTTFSGTVSSSDPAFVGGIAGKATGKFKSITIGGKIEEISTYETLCTPSGVAVGGVVGKASSATFETITVEGANIKGTYIAGGIVGVGENITITGSATQGITGATNSYSNKITTTTTITAASSIQPYPLVTASYAGGVVGKVSGISTIEACLSSATVDAGWKPDVNADRLTARDFFWYQAGNNGDDEDKEEKTQEKLKKRVQQVNAAAQGAETAYAGGIAGYASGTTTFSLLENCGSVTSHAKTQLSLTTASRYDVQNIWGYFSYDAYAHYAKETENAYAAGVAAFMSETSTLEKCLNNGSITGGGEVEFNLFTTDEESRDNVYKTYALDYSFDYTEDGGKTNIKTVFEDLYSENPAATQAWIKAQDEGITLVGSGDAGTDYYKYGDNHYPLIAENSGDYDNYVLITNWTKDDEEETQENQTQLHYTNDKSTTGLSMVYPEGLDLIQQQFHIPLEGESYSTGQYYAPFCFILTYVNDKPYIQGPRIHIFEQIRTIETPLVDATTGETMTDANGNTIMTEGEVTDYYYYNVVKKENGEYTLGSRAEVKYGESGWGELAAQVSGYKTIEPQETFKAYYAGGSECDFPTKDNFNNPSYAFKLSNTDGEIATSKTYFKLSEDYAPFKLLDIQIVVNTGDIEILNFPDKEPYDSIAPDIDNDIISGDTVAVWQAGQSITLDGTTYAPLDGSYSIQRGIYTYTQEFADTGKEVWFATWTGAGNERMYAILHWQKDTDILMYLIPQDGDVYIQGFIFESDEEYTDGMTFTSTSNNITYTILQYKPASTTE